MAKKLLRRGPGRRAKVLALRGELGAGKTTFVQGFFKGLGIKRLPASPTFIFMRRTRMSRRSGFENVFHVDGYRARGPADLRILDLPAIFEEPRNVVLVEWPERLGRFLPHTAKEIRFRHGRHAGERVLSYGQ